MKLQKISSILLELAEKTNGKPVDLSTKSKIEDLLKNQRFVSDDKVPDWLINLLQAVVDRREVEQTHFNESKLEGNAFGLLHSLEMFLNVEVEDEGEILVIDFPKIYVQTIIIWMGYTYEVIEYSQDV